jgi:hypothetical protein
MHDNHREPRWRQAENRYREEANGNRRPGPASRHGNHAHFSGNASDDYHAGRDFAGGEG